MKPILLTLLFFTSSLLAQSVGDFILPEKVSTTGRVTNRFWPKGALTLWGTDGSSLPSRIVVGSGLTLSGSPLTLTSAGGGASALDDLTDVTITTATTGQVLRYNGSAWVNYTHGFLTSSDLSGYATTAAVASAYASLTGSYSNPSWITALAWSKISGTPTSLAGYGISDGITAATVASTYAPLASPTFTGTVTIPSGALIDGYATAADVMSGYLPRSTAADEFISALTQSVGLSASELGLNFVLSGINSEGALLALREAPANGTHLIGLLAPASVTSDIVYILPQSPASGGLMLTSGGVSGGQSALTWQAVVAPAGTLTGTTLASNVVSSSLTSLGTIATGVWQGSIIAPAYLGTGSSITTKYLRGDGTWQTISGGGDALTTSSLDQFADVTQTAGKTLAITDNTTLNGGTHSGNNTGDQTTITGNAGTATALQTGRTLAITGDLAWTSPSFDGTGNVTAAGTLATVATAGTTGSSTAIPVITINAKGLTTGISTAAVIAPAGTLTGTTLASNVVNSSLTSLGTIATGVWQGTAIADSYISSAATWNAKESALTFSTGLTRSTNTITVNTSQNIATLSNLTSNGFVKTSGGTGALSIDTATYLTTTGNGSSLTGLTQSQISGTVALANGGTGASLTDPNADRIPFWDDSAGAMTWLTPGTGLNITGTTIDASGGGGGGGIVLQQAQTVDTTNRNTGNNSYTASGLECVLASNLKDTGSKVRIRVYCVVGAGAACLPKFTLYTWDGSTATALTPSGVDCLQATFVSASNACAILSFEFVHSPASTTPLTYRLYMASDGVSTTVYLGRRGLDTFFSAPNIMTVEELD